MAKLKARIPSGAGIPSDRSRRDKAFVGSSFRVAMPSGYDVYFAERHTEHAQARTPARDCSDHRLRQRGRHVVLRGKLPRRARVALPRLLRARGEARGTDQPAPSRWPERPLQAC